MVRYLRYLRYSDIWSLKRELATLAPWNIHYTLAKATRKMHYTISDANGKLFRLLTLLRYMNFENGISHISTLNYTLYIIASYLKQALYNSRR